MTQTTEQPPKAEPGDSSRSSNCSSIPEPAWLTRLANGNGQMSDFVAREIATEVRELMIYKQAMESMARQMIHPKMTALEMATAQLRDTSSRA